MSIPGAASPLFIGAAAGAAAGYQIDRSLRFNDGDSANLTRTPSSAGNRKTFTWSGWVKRGSLGTRQNIFSGGSNATSTHHTYINFMANNTIELETYSSNAMQWKLATDAVFRDCSAWQHIVWTVDTSQNTASDRVKLYTNGTQVTSFSSATYPTQNYEGGINAAAPHAIGKYSADFGPDPFDGYLAEINFVDGQALAATDFGELDSNSVWQPKDTSGLTFGTNGFRLKFDDNSSNAALGDDSSGNDNDWTVNNLTAAVVPVDVGGDPAVSSSDKPFTTGFSVAFDGNDKMRMEGPGTVSGDFTWECWVKFTGTPDGRFFSAEENVNGTEYSLMRFYNGNLNVYSGDGNGYEANTYTGTVSANTWHHIAMVRSGSTVSHYLDGSRWGTNTYSNSFSITTLVLAHGYGGEYFTGSVSNARFVNGQALYTGTSYTVPTATLTTTSQSATASNVTTLVAHKASLTANDGTKIEILNSSSGIDSLIDTPTNYTADSGNNGGNYCTWNPLSETGATLANGNLEATLTAAGSGQESVRGTIAVSSGKFYWEELLSDTGNQSGHYGVVAASTGPNIRLDATSGANAVLYAAWNGNKAVDGTSTSYGASFTTNDIIGVALDLDAGTITFYKNNVSQGSINLPTTGIAYTPTFAWSGGSSAGTTKTNWGQRSFSFTPPTGYKSLCTTNLADPTIADGSTAFDIKLWTGNATARSITGYNFSPDFAWIKDRTGTDYHSFIDIVRGGTKVVFSNTSIAEETQSQAITSFNSDGFDLGTWQAVNKNNGSFVGWAWDAGTSTVSNTDGSITSSVRANPSAGFSIVSYNGDNNAGDTVGHGLSAKPGWILIKNRDDAFTWYVYHSTSGGTKYLRLDTSNAETTGSGAFNNTEPTSSVFSLGQDNAVNDGNKEYIAYCWAPVSQYSAFGSYQGNSSADGPFVYTGMRPKFVLLRNTSRAENWVIYDDLRSDFNAYLAPNTNDAEGSFTQPVFALSNGFQLGDTRQLHNRSGDTYIYAAFAEHPFKTARAR